MLYVMSTFNAHNSADARQSAVPSFDLVSLLGMSYTHCYWKKRKLQNISEKVIGPHADKNSHTFAVTMYTNVITLPMKPLFVSPSRTLV